MVIGTPLSEFYEFDVWMNPEKPAISKSSNQLNRLAFDLVLNSNGIFFKQTNKSVSMT